MHTKHNSWSNCSIYPIIIHFDTFKMNQHLLKMVLNKHFLYSKKSYAIEHEAGTGKTNHPIKSPWPYFNGNVSNKKATIENILEVAMIHFRIFPRDIFAIDVHTMCICVSKILSFPETSMRCIISLSALINWALSFKGCFHHISMSFANTPTGTSFANTPGQHPTRRDTIVESRKEWFYKKHSQYCQENTQKYFIFIST